MAQTRIIKKYPNRRLYDTEISSYITLEEVRQLVVLLVIQRNDRLQRHTADRAVAGVVLSDFWVHRTGVDRAGRCGGRLA